MLLFFIKCEYNNPRFIDITLRPLYSLRNSISLLYGNLKYLYNCVPVIHYINLS